MAWVDNLFSFGSLPDNSVMIFSRFEDVLMKDWSQTLKDDSKEVLITAGCDDILTYDATTWKTVGPMTSLGHILMNNARPCALH